MRSEGVFHSNPPCYFPKRITTGARACDVLKALCSSQTRILIIFCYVRNAHFLYILRWWLVAFSHLAWPCRRRDDATLLRLSSAGANALALVCSWNAATGKPLNGSAWFAICGRTSRRKPLALLAQTAPPNLRTTTPDVHWDDFCGDDMGRFGNRVSKSWMNSPLVEVRGWKRCRYMALVESWLALGSWPHSFSHTFELCSSFDRQTVMIGQLE